MANIEDQKQQVRFTIDGEELELSEGEHPVTEVLELAGRTPGEDILIEIDEHFENGFQELTETVVIVEGKEFSARPPTGQAA